MQGFLSQALFLYNLPWPCQTPCPDLAEMFHSSGWMELRHECCCELGGGRSPWTKRSYAWVDQHSTGWVPGRRDEAFLLSLDRKSTRLNSSH